MDDELVTQPFFWNKGILNLFSLQLDELYDFAEQIFAELLIRIKNTISELFLTSVWMRRVCNCGKPVTVGISLLENIGPSRVCVSGYIVMSP